MFKSKRLVLGIVTVFFVFMAVISNNLLTNEANKKPRKFKKCEACVPKTGQTTSYALGDDGDLQMGISWPIPRFTDNEDGTATDNLTGLMWSKDANIYGLQTWTDALALCDSCTVGGYADWRLPNIRELQSLMDYERLDPALPSGYPFTNVWFDFYWSSTTYIKAPSCAWSVYLYDGRAIGSGLGKGGGQRVWPVRGGK